MGFVTKDGVVIKGRCAGKVFYLVAQFLVLSIACLRYQTDPQNLAQKEATNNQRDLTNSDPAIDMQGMLSAMQHRIAPNMISLRSKLAPGCPIVFFRALLLVSVERDHSCELASAIWSTPRQRSHHRLLAWRAAGNGIGARMPMHPDKPDDSSCL